MKKKAFTLTELLVVVVIIGALSAVVLPKFNKVIESRRTAEAESVMRAVRNEQEMRCTLDKNYTINKDNLAVWPKRDSANYTYALNSQGMSATRKDKDYTLEIKTYLDGGICCSGSYCASLNKDYPNCEDYEATPNTKDCVPAGVEGESGVEPNPEPEPEPTPVCEVPIRTLETQPCGCTNKGTKKRTFDKEACEWGKWSACSEKEENCCAIPAQTTQTQACGCTNKGTKTRTFDEESCAWSEWSACSETEENCCAIPAQTTQTQACGCTNKGTKTRTFNEESCSWNEWGKCSEEEDNCSCDPDGSKRAACVSEKIEGERTYRYTYNEENCECTEYCVYGYWSRKNLSDFYITIPSGGKAGISAMSQVRTVCEDNNSYTPKCNTIDINSGKRGDPDCYVCGWGMFGGGHDANGEPKAGTSGHIYVNVTQYSCGSTRTSRFGGTTGTRR